MMNNLYISLSDYCEEYKKRIDAAYKDTLKKSLYFLKNKAKTLSDIYENAQYLIKEDIQILEEDLKLLDRSSKEILKSFLNDFKELTNINKENLEIIIKSLIEKHKTNFKGIGQPLRIVLTGSKFGPGIYDIIMSLDKKKIIKRLSKF